MLALALVTAGGACGRRAPDKAGGPASGAAGSGAPVETRDTPVAKGAALYATLCATCHGPAGNGYIADNAPSLKTTTFLATATDEFLQAAILPRPSRDGDGRVRAGDGRAPRPRRSPGHHAFLRKDGPPRVTPPTIATTPDVGRGQVLYERFCRRCHGTPTQRVSAVHLANSVLLETASDAFLRHAVEHGRPPTSMAAWGATLGPQQIDDVVGYVRSLATPAPAFAAPPKPPSAAPTPPSQPAPPALPPAAPRIGPIVLNPKGRAPTFTMRDGMFVPMDQVKQALDQKRRLVIADARGPAEWTSLRIKGAKYPPRTTTRRRWTTSPTTAPG